MSQPLFAVAGVTGHTGRVVADTLLSQGARVRVIVRDPAKGAAWAARGAEVAVADLGDPDALTAALTRVDGAYLLIPPRMAPGFRAYQSATAASLVTAVRRSGVAHTVVLSSVGAQHPTGTGPVAALHELEEALREVAASGTQAVTFLRAGYFMENLGSSLGALSDGLLPVFVPVDQPIPMVATPDIGRLGAELLLAGGRGVQIVELGGPDRTTEDAAAALTEILGRPITPVAAPLDAMVPTLVGFGLPADVAELYRELHAGIVGGHVAWEGGHRRVLGTTTLRETLAGLVGRR